MQMSTDGFSLYKEIQQTKPRWVWAVVVLACVVPAGILIATLVRQLQNGTPVGNHPMSNGGLIATIVLFCALDLAILWLFAKWQLLIEVRNEGLFVHMRPFVRRTIAWDDIESADARTYKPLAEYGGWGIRGTRKNRALSMSGNRGVQLVLKDGDRLLMGSQNPEPLAEAIRRKLRA